jgi:hypothetical protein
MDDFKALLNKQVSHLTKQAKKEATSAPAAPRAVKPALKAVAPVTSEPALVEPETPEALELEAPAVRSKPGRGRKSAKEAGYQLNRVTVNLFETDKRALATISEKLAHAGHTFTNRSDSMKIGLRLAAKASKEELAALYEKVKSEDRRFRNAE